MVRWGLHTLRAAARLVTSHGLVVEPDHHLREHLGEPYARFINPIILAEGQKVIDSYAVAFKVDVSIALVNLREAIHNLRPGSIDPAGINKVRDNAFAIKCNTEYCGYGGLAIPMAGSLDAYCSRLPLGPLTFGTLDVMNKFADALNNIFAKSIRNPTYAITLEVLNGLNTITAPKEQVALRLSGKGQRLRDLTL